MPAVIAVGGHPRVAQIGLSGMSRAGMSLATSKPAFTAAVAELGLQALTPKFPRFALSHVNSNPGLPLSSLDRS